MIYWVRQGVDVLATPLMLALLIAVVALIFRMTGMRRRTRWLFVVAAAVAYLGSTTVVGDLLLGPLEHRFPPLRDDQIAGSEEFIVVLGSGYTPGGGVPVTAALDEDGLARVVEGVRLLRYLDPRAVLVLSGGAPPGSGVPAVGYSMLAQALGVKSDAKILLSDSLNTADEARAVAAAIGSASFLLVTSAYHMPRAMRLMERAGAHPIPAPTKQMVSARQAFDVRDWLPSSYGLRKSERALHEYVGLFALRLQLQ